MVKQITDYLGQAYQIRGNYRRLALYCGLVVIIYSLHDVLLDWILTILHTSFEWFEFALEELIEHIFHTNRQQTQAIVFYLLLSLGISVCYCLGRKSIIYSRSLCQKALDEWAGFKIRMSHFWRHQSTLVKIKLVLSGSASFIVLAVYLFS